MYANAPDAGAGPPTPFASGAGLANAPPGTTVGVVSQPSYGYIDNNGVVQHSTSPITYDPQTQNVTTQTAGGPVILAGSGAPPPGSIQPAPPGGQSNLIGNMLGNPIPALNLDPSTWLLIIGVIAVVVVVLVVF